MPRRFHELKIETFVQATEDESLVIQAIENLIQGKEIGEKERFEIEGINKNPILLIIFKIKKEREIISLLDLWKDMDFWSRGMEDVEDRLDESLVYHLRLDKMSTFKGEPALWKGGESMEIKLKIATFPSSREGALKVLRTI